MQTITTTEKLDQLIQQETAVLVLFGGTNCNVCHSIKPKLEDMIQEQYPLTKMVYIDCHETTDICAQKSVLSLPTLQVFFTGQKSIEKVRTFSLKNIADEIKRPYGMVF